MKQEVNQKIKSGYDSRKRNVLRRCLNIASDGADVEDCSRSWRPKLEKRVCRLWRDWTAV